MGKPQKITLRINGGAILDFNSNLGMGGDWGHYSNAFDATHFLEVDFPGSELGNFPPTLLPDSEVTFKVSFAYENSDYVFEIDHIRMTMIGASAFEEATPRDAWSYIFALDETDGAIGFNGHYFLGQAEGSEVFKMKTSPNLNDGSCNLSYSIRFSISYAGHIKYCQIDPLMRTSGGHT